MEHLKHEGERPMTKGESEIAGGLDKLFEQHEYELHVPVEQYGFIKKTIEGDDRQAIKEYVSLGKAYAERENPGLDDREWKRVRTHMLKTSEFDPNLGEQLNDYQKYFINEAKKTLRDIGKEE